MDAEVVAIDPATGALKTFQELSNRARKDVKLDEVKVAVCVFAFDLMYIDGQVSYRRLPMRFVPAYAGSMNAHRSSWKDRSASAGACFEHGFHLTRRHRRARRGSITSKASRAKTGGKPSRNSGRPP